MSHFVTHVAFQSAVYTSLIYGRKRRHWIAPRWDHASRVAVRLSVLSQLCGSRTRISLPHSKVVGDQGLFNVSADYRSRLFWATCIAGLACDQNQLQLTDPSVYLQLKKMKIFS